jgi:hypothetical protein
LIDKYFPDKDQINLFAEPLTVDEMINQSYEMRNRDIGYRIDDEDDNIFNNNVLHTDRIATERL